MEANTNVSRELWSLEQLAMLVRKTHSAPVRGDSGAPIIVVRHAGHYCLLDGRRRVSAWRRNQDVGPHPVNLVAII